MKLAQKYMLNTTKVCYGTIEWDCLDELLICAFAIDDIEQEIGTAVGERLKELEADMKYYSERYEEASERYYRLLTGRLI